MRRLPVYLLLDTSGSMAGRPIEQVISGVQMLVAGLRQDPHALESVSLGVITFATEAREVASLTELIAFQSPTLQAGGATSLGAALLLLSECAKRDVIKTTAAQKGDWRPMVFLMTDGKPTDDWKKALVRFNQEKWAVVVACAVDSAEPAVLKQIAGERNVVCLDSSDPAAITAFFKWVTASVSSSSLSIERSAKEVTGLAELPPPPKEIKIVI
ncbi:MAG: VWA domain-containing protein [Verrucomicrobiota bacterium]